MCAVYKRLSALICFNCNKIKKLPFGFTVVIFFSPGHNYRDKKGVFVSYVVSYIFIVLIKFTLSPM